MEERDEIDVSFFMEFPFEVKLADFYWKLLFEFDPWNEELTIEVSFFVLFILINGIFCPNWSKLLTFELPLMTRLLLIERIVMFCPWELVLLERFGAVTEIESMGEFTGEVLGKIIVLFEDRKEEFSAIRNEEGDEGISDNEKFFVDEVVKWISVFTGFYKVPPFLKFNLKGIFFKPLSLNIFEVGFNFLFKFWSIESIFSLLAISMIEV